MSRVLALVVLAAMAAKPAGWRAAEGGRVTFSGEQVGGAYSGMITGIAGEGCFDPAHPEAASGRFAFDLAMATTGIRDRDDIMRAPEWLNTARFP
ncbi:MAG TPA: YceI family protein, partial [Sphingomonadales bacterium]|nr:YceI family protein [Sphingomonadales bacterium]